MRKEELVVALWQADGLKTKLKRKFGALGWFKCYKNSAGVYDTIGFAPTIEFDDWIALVRNGTVYIDGAMYVTNHRNYSNWRANNSFWDQLIKEKYN
jgi:hypothetical protein